MEMVITAIGGRHRLGPLAAGALTARQEAVPFTKVAVHRVVDATAKLTDPGAGTV